jgi:hypothetical protein
MELRNNKLSFGREDAIFSDRLNHASIIDGILLSGAKLFRFQHNDLNHLESLLDSKRHKFREALIITETIFSMDGDLCPIEELVDLKERYDCKIMVDEAHATGIFGQNGYGMVEEKKKKEVRDMTQTNSTPSSDFIREIIEEDIRNGKHQAGVATRFPPEPNGYLHIGHAKSVCLNFGIAAQYGGTCNLRLDDTDPTGEDQEYADSIIRDVKWLGFDWEDRLFYASDYYEQLYQYAVKLIKEGKAYVCSLSADEIREYRGTLTQPEMPRQSHTTTNRNPGALGVTRLLSIWRNSEDRNTHRLMSAPSIYCHRTASNR